ncbi:MAG: ATP-binding protein [Candidatus Zixiibacteriota bacterium]|nr:MAG: ATP-binding protein [candidate division Zixibacteria bacterium]HDL03544.1 ATP-binding protein [candidate division Zixibacteria bacterium]
MDKPIITESSIKIPSSQEFLVDVDGFLEGRLVKHGVDKGVIADIAISVTEIVNNAIVHGNKSVFEKAVTVEIKAENSEVEIVITDEGDGFDPHNIKSPIEDDNLLKEVGRGIFITRALMDKVDIDSGPGRPTRVTLSKHI